MAIMQTIVQYLIVIVLLIAGFFLITSLSQQDWMRVEASMKIPRDMFDTIKNRTSSMVPTGGSTSKDETSELFEFLDKLPPDASIEMKDHFGLQKSCSYITMEGFENPIKLLVPELKWCRDNEVFIKPTKYGLPSYVRQYFKDEGDALKNARICMILAILCVALAVIVLLVKVFKWQKESVFATVTLALLSCICVIAALGVIHNNFNFKKDFERMKYAMRSPYRNYGYKGRRRRDDGSPGYSGKYTTSPTPSIGGGASGSSSSSASGGAEAMQKEIMEIVKVLILSLEIDEYVGSPLRYAGIGVGFLLVVIVLNGVEFHLIRKHGGIEVKYHNVELA